MLYLKIDRTRDSPKYLLVDSKFILVLVLLIQET